MFWETVSRPGIVGATDLIFGAIWKLFLGEEGLVGAILGSTYKWATSRRIFQVFLIKGRVTFSAAGASFVFFSSFVGGGGFFSTLIHAAQGWTSGREGKHTRFE